MFTPGKNTTVTYVERTSDGAAEELRDHIRRGGWMVSLVGPTKMGKTVLAHREAPNGFFIPGSSIQDVDDFWARFASFLGIPTEESRTRVTGDRSRWGFFGNLAFFGSDVGGEHHIDRGTSSTSTINADQAAEEAVKAIVAADGQVTIVIDDFHFIPAATRTELLRSLKPIVWNGATVVLVTLPHRHPETEATQLDGRTATVRVKEWDEADLEQIASLGLPKLNLTDPAQLGATLASASYGSPQIMQHLCLELVEKVNGVLATKDRPTAIVGPSDWQTFHQRVRDGGATRWVERFIGGPPVRGQKRKTHTLTDGRTFDGYQVIIAALKELGPPLSLSTTDLTAKIDEMLEGAKATEVSVGQKLAQMSEIAAKPLRAKLKEAETEDVTPAELFDPAVIDPSAGDPQPVFEYTPDAVKNTIHILEPYVAYTIRWHVDSLLSA